MSTASVMQIVMNVFTRVFVYLCGKVAQSKHRALSIDGTSDVRERNPIAIRISGVHDGYAWCYPLHFCEPGDHKAATQLKEIINMLNTINDFNEVRLLWSCCAKNSPQNSSIFVAQN